MNPEAQLDALVNAAGQGDRGALDDVVPGLYETLHRIAAQQMRRERAGGLLQTTAVVHEAYFRLSSQQRSQWRDRAGFFAAAANIMRRVLIDNARQEQAAKRGGDRVRRELADYHLAVDDCRFSALETSEALSRLAEFAPDQAAALEMIVFGGMTGEEVAGVLGVSASTVDRRVRSAKAWLRRELHD